MNRIRNTFKKPPTTNGLGPVQDENAHPLSGTDTNSLHSSYAGSRASSSLSIKKKEEPAEYKLSVVNGGVYLPPSPPEKKSYWPKSPMSSRTNSHRSMLNENEPFSISRESFESYRRSFDISARSPVNPNEASITPRQSLDAKATGTPKSRLSSSQFERPAPTEEELFEDVGLDGSAKPADAAKQPANKKKGIFSRFGENQPEPPASGEAPRPTSSHRGFHLPGRKRGQSGQGAELGNIDRLGTQEGDDGVVKRKSPAIVFVQIGIYNIANPHPASTPLKHRRAKLVKLPKSQTRIMATEKPVAIVCVGMAGSGKTTFMQRINSHLHSKRDPPYVINLDPAVRNVPFESNIDIRDSLNYKEVMKEYNLGPNGGILTSLNIFSTKIDQIINILEKRTAPNPETPKAKPIRNIIVDTPGQIEVFVWSASGSILLDSLASSFPTVIAYIIDTPRTSSTSTFMSNMLYACSILYKTKLPMILVFNKTDVRDAEFAKEWMTDFESFQAALRAEEASGNGGGSGYMGTLLNSMSLMLEEFYKHLSVVGVSSMTGQGVDDFFSAVKEKAQVFQRDYQPELDKRREQAKQMKTDKKDRELGKMMKDMEVSDSVTGQKGPAKPVQRHHVDTVSDLEDSDSEPEAKLVEPDGEGSEEGEDEEGLTKRYKDALGDEGQNSKQSASEESFARYLRQGQM